MPARREKPVLVVDTREKQPWDFSCDDGFANIVSEKLEVGDYSIKGMEHLITIERKATADELFGNFSQDKKRIYAEFDRAPEGCMKIIVVEQTLEQLAEPKQYFVNNLPVRDRRRPKTPKMPPAVVLSNLTELMLTRNVHVIFGGLKARAIARGILMRAYDLHRLGKWNNESDSE